MRALRLRLLFLCFLTLCGMAAGADGETVPFTLGIAAGTVDIVCHDGRLVQSLPYAGDEPDEHNREFFAFAKDMDFDGNPDVGILFSQGMQNIFYDAWLWRPDARAFVKYEGMRELSNPEFDSETQRVTSFEHGSAVSNATTVLAWESGKLAVIEQTIQDLADDGENIVISRYERGEDGELRLVGEKTITPEELEKCGEGGEDRDDDELDSAEAAGHGVIPSGLPACADPDYQLATLPNGEWWWRYRTDDTPMFLESRRLPAGEYGDEAVLGLIRKEWPEARNVTYEPFRALAEKLTYPAIVAEFLTGANEDARQHVGAMVFMDDWSYWFALEAPADADPPSAKAETPGEALARNLILRRDMQVILLDLEFIGPEEGNFLPGPGIDIYDSESPALEGMSVMDALIRIKMTAAPEENPWIKAWECAYRYDGAGTVAGKPALLFSFGGDSPEKFTAERHFAVDREGAVYEMDILAGGEYWRCDDTPGWWGEYADGGKKLVIGNYREGPSGMCFVCAFSIGGVEQSGLTVPARGRNASGDGLLFNLSKDDSVVTVTAGDNADEAAEQLVGRYVRR